MKKNRCLSMAVCLTLFVVLVCLFVSASVRVSGRDNADSETVSSDSADSEMIEGDNTDRKEGTVTVEQPSDPDTARPSVNGKLHVEGTSLVDEAGKKVQLRGVSTHGLTWFPNTVNEDLFRIISEDWNANLIRLAMYSEIYCTSEKDKEISLELVRKGIEAAVEADLYVIVDWHILHDADPNEHADEAEAFFDLITEEYGDLPNLILEICNEPNGETTWTDISRYCDRIIPVIRQKAPETLILVGTPEYDKNLGDPVLRPLSDSNVMYVLHFYAATHNENLRSELETAVDYMLPVFVSECGLSEASGDGILDFASATEWFRCLNDLGVSYAVWSLSDKDESSALLKPGYEPGDEVNDSDLTPCGYWVRELLRGTEPEKIAVPTLQIEKKIWSKLRSWLAGALTHNTYGGVSKWLQFAGIAVAVLLLLLGGLNVYYNHGSHKKEYTYDHLLKKSQTAAGDQKPSRKPERSIKSDLINLLLFISQCLTLIYLCWRIRCSIPLDAGVLPVILNLLLLVVEVLGFMESLVLYRTLMGLKEHPLPQIPEEAFPEVDIFIATYNEPTELLRRTVNGCRNLQYPDPSRVHVWICDDNQRPQMRALAEEMGVGYFDRPDHKGAKAGNLNHALSLTSAPYIVTLDADMIPKSDFLLKTIPYFVDAEIRNQSLPEEERLPLGLLQTPQCFYDPDVFQFALYADKRAPNEQDFFYRTIEPGRTSTNSVIYGGSNTVLSRKALEDVGGFYTESITEDFATGLLIEAAGYVSLSLPEPLASGQTPHTFREHIQQRTRWGRGVIVTAKKLKLWRRRELNFMQKISYWSSVVYWYSPVKTLIYQVSPLFFAVFGLPVFRCNWLELLVFWAPMFLIQDLTLRIISRERVSLKWSGIYETSVMAHLLVPVIKEFFGRSLSEFKVTDKSRKTAARQSDLRAMIPFLILIAFSVVGLIRICIALPYMGLISFVILLYWMSRNLYFLIMACFLVNGRDGDGEPVVVRDAEFVQIQVLSYTNGTEEPEKGPFPVYEGVTTCMTEHSLTIYPDEGAEIKAGAYVSVILDHELYRAKLRGVITGVRESRSMKARTLTIEILDYGEDLYQYWGILYDRVPTLPQTLHKDYGFLFDLWQNVAHRIARTRR